ncbi:HetZ-related protein 2 [Phormidium nigroviride]
MKPIFQHLMTLAEELGQKWSARLQQDYPDMSAIAIESIVRWLLGEKPERFEALPPAQRAIASQAIEFQYGILRQRYLGVTPEQAYRNLIGRLGGLVVLREKIKAWVALSRDRQRSAVEVLQEVIQEMLKGDRYLQQQIAWIAECTADKRLRNALLLANLEEYCLRPIRNQPLLVYRFVNYLHRTQRGGLTQVPAGDWVRLVSEEIVPQDADDKVSLLDEQAVEQYRENQAWEEQQGLRKKVQVEFQAYLADEVDPMAAEWLRLYLLGRSQEAIAQALNIPVKQIYRLREKVTYHAIRNFAVKGAPELVASWLETSFEHNLGLPPKQWQEFWESLTPVQKQLIQDLKAGKTVDAIASEMKIKTNHVIGEWSKIYLAAQNLRNG